VGFRPAGLSLAAAGESPDNAVFLFDVAAGTPILRLAGRDSCPQSGAWRADGGLLAAVGESDGEVRLWDFGHAVPGQHVVPVFEPRGDGIEAVAFSPEGRCVVTANPDGTIAIFRLPRTEGASRTP
jgi:WD40 repeat protein